MKIFDKISEVGLKNVLIGTIKREQYKKMQKKYGFDNWHVSPYELREYAQVVANYVSEQNCEDKMVVDIGCGMGEVISNIKQNNRFGYDLDDVVIGLAPSVHSKEKVEYRCGSFDELCKDFDAGTSVSYLITLNFMHGNTEEKWIDYYHKVASHLDVEHFIVDTVKENNNGAHRLDFTKILPKNYVLEEKKGPFLGERFVEVYKKVD